MKAQINTSADDAEHRERHDFLYRRNREIRTPDRALRPASAPAQGKARNPKKLQTIKKRWISPEGRRRREKPKDARISSWLSRSRRPLRRLRRRWLHASPTLRPRFDLVFSFALPLHFLCSPLFFLCSPLRSLCRRRDGVRSSGPAPAAQRRLSARSRAGPKGRRRRKQSARPIARAEPLAAASKGALRRGGIRSRIYA